MEPLTEQQIVGICQLQQSTQEAEDALSQGLDALHQSLSDTIISDSLSCSTNMGNYMAQMAMAMNKLSTLEGFVRQVDRPSYVPAASLSLPILTLPFYHLIFNINSYLVCPQKMNIYMV